MKRDYSVWYRCGTILRYDIRLTKGGGSKAAKADEPIFDDQATPDQQPVTQRLIKINPIAVIGNMATKAL